MLAIDQDALPVPLPGRARVDEHCSRLPAHPLEKSPHHPARSRALDPARFPVDESRPIRVEKQIDELVGVVARQIEQRRSDIGARAEARHFPCCRSKSGFVEVVQVKIGEAVVALKASEIFKMKISACP